MQKSAHIAEISSKVAGVTIYVHPVHQKHVDALVEFVFHHTAQSMHDIGRFNQRQGEALPPQIFLTEVCGLGKTTE